VARLRRWIEWQEEAARGSPFASAGEYLPTGEELAALRRLGYVESQE